MRELSTTVVPELHDQELGPIIEEEIPLGGHLLVVARPALPDRLLDLGVVAKAYEDDEYMPYWATIWPVSRELGKLILGSGTGEGKTAIELGCGLGVAGLSALKRGYAVTFTDWDPTCLRFVERNAKAIGDEKLLTKCLDWRDAARLDQTYDLVIASDLTYERRNVEPLVEAFVRLARPDTLILAADQNRAFAPDFRAALEAAGFCYEMLPVALDPKTGVKGKGTIYRIRWSKERARIS